MPTGENSPFVGHASKILKITLVIKWNPLYQRHVPHMIIFHGIVDGPTQVVLISHLDAFVSYLPHLHGHLVGGSVVVQ